MVEEEYITITIDARKLIKHNYANQASLGLLAFGMTTVLLNFSNAGFFGLSAIYVGLAEVINESFGRDFLPT